MYFQHLVGASLSIEKDSAQHPNKETYVKGNLKALDEWSVYSKSIMEVCKISKKMYINTILKNVSVFLHNVTNKIHILTRSRDKLD